LAINERADDRGLETGVKCPFKFSGVKHLRVFTSSLSEAGGSRSHQSNSPPPNPDRLPDFGETAFLWMNCECLLHTLG
jgi:hypothetical protein